MMEIQPDFKEFLELLNKNKVDYIIVGGYALAFHGAPRYTGDIDIFVKMSEDNSLRIIKALQDFGFGSLNIGINDFQTENNVIQLGLPPVRIDILTGITGITWDQAKKGAILGFYGDVSVYFIGKKEFIHNKKSTHRKKDSADVEALGE